MPPTAAVEFAPVSLSAFAVSESSSEVDDGLAAAPASLLVFPSWLTARSFVMVSCRSTWLQMIHRPFRNTAGFMATKSELYIACRCKLGSAACAHNDMV